MKANVGDWLIVKVRGEGHERRAAILSVGQSGLPPFTVRWMDTGHEGIVFPGPTDMVVSASAMAEADRMQNERIKQVQSAIVGGSG